jgi:hypothetical protein
MFFVTNSNADNLEALFALKSMLVLWEIGVTVAILMYPRIYYVIHPPPAEFFQTQRPPGGRPQSFGTGHGQTIGTPNGTPVNPQQQRMFTVNSKVASDNSGGHVNNRGTFPPQQSNVSREGGASSPPTGRLSSPENQVRHVTHIIHRPSFADSASAHAATNPLFAEVRSQLGTPGTSVIDTPIIRPHASPPTNAWTINGTTASSTSSGAVALAMIGTINTTFPTMSGNGTESVNMNRNSRPVSAAHRLGSIHHLSSTTSPSPVAQSSMTKNMTVGSTHATTSPFSSDTSTNEQTNTPIVERMDGMSTLSVTVPSPAVVDRTSLIGQNQPSSSTPMAIAAKQDLHRYESHSPHSVNDNHRPNVAVVSLHAAKYVDGQ